MGIKAVVVVFGLPLLSRQNARYHQSMRFIIAVAALAIATALPAQNPGGIPWEDPPDRRMTVKRPVNAEWMVGVDAGRTSFQQPEFDKRATRFVAFVERNVLPWLGVQADVNCGKGSVAASAFNPSSAVSLCTAALSAVLPIPIAYSFWPYVRVGGGYAFWDEDAVEGYWNTDDVSPALVAAAGLRYFPFGNDKIAIRLDFQRTQTSLRSLKVGQRGFGFGVSVRIP